VCGTVRVRPSPLPSRYFRSRNGVDQEATWLELFFDLVFVFAITQLSHYLLGHLNWDGAARTVFLLLVVWWAWIYTTWMANWFDPEAAPVRLVLMGVMLASLLMAVAIPHAFGTEAVLFACAYVALQVGRNLFIVVVTDPTSAQRRTFLRILVWSLVTAPLWLAGAFAPEGVRVTIWVVALVIDYLAPLVGYWVPGLGGSATTEWQIDSAHFSERFQLFIIIALGESIVVAGAAASSTALSPARLVALTSAFVVSAALWWLYFDEVAAHAQDRLRRAGADREALGRDAYTYLHIPIVAGIILSAVGDQLLIAAPSARLAAVGAIAVLGGPALYLIGHNLFRARMVQTVSIKRIVASVVLIASVAGAPHVAALWVGIWAAVVLVVLVASEYRGRLRADAVRGESELVATG
jgi:low temperature requirement protein LtrA